MCFKDPWFKNRSYIWMSLYSCVYMMIIAEGRMRKCIYKYICSILCCAHMHVFLYLWVMDIGLMDPNSWNGQCTRGRRTLGTPYQDPPTHPSHMVGMGCALGNGPRSLFFRAVQCSVSTSSTLCHAHVSVTTNKISNARNSMYTCGSRACQLIHFIISVSRMCAFREN